MLSFRVNTFRRNDLLEKFLEHYTTCPEVCIYIYIYIIAYICVYQLIAHIALRQLVYFSLFHLITILSSVCMQVREVTVVWSDLKNAPPAHLAPSRYAPGKVRYEMHKADSISNRFKALDPVPTEVRYVPAAAYGI